ncbi:hypothetical protein PR202_ga10956 [Eleusine coracana subsp. coracana]|uniref:Gnk2-homologous domain-containing protein n=1 Tax=Eleusine coracana subsp. coracana TaxID=191504 RepID=A0AAV5C897_ELECO|nr:hypothetical protein PR202_ga10956 [Eleusine coracana subsp. coracana]
MRLKMKLPKVHVEKLMGKSKDAAEAASKIMKFCSRRRGGQTSREEGDGIGRSMTATPGVYEWRRNHYTAGSAYETNLNRVIDALPSNASSSSTFFAKATVGTVYTIGLCRLDLAAFSCHVCLESGLSDAKVACPFAMDASINMDGCHMRFSNLNFLTSKTNSVQQAFFSRPSSA